MVLFAFLTVIIPKIQCTRGSTVDRSLTEVREIQCDVFSHLHSVLRRPMKVFLFTDYREKKKAIKEKAALER